MKKVMEIKVNEEICNFVLKNRKYIPKAKILNNKLIISCEDFLNFNNRAINLKLDEFNKQYNTDLSLIDLIIDKEWPKEVDWYKEFDPEIICFALKRRIAQNKNERKEELSKEFINKYLTKAFKKVFMNYDLHSKAFMGSIK